MKLSIRPRPAAVCEFGESITRALVFRSDDAGIEPLGYGEAPTEGYRDGRFLNFSDAAESVRAAVRSAARQSGFWPKRLCLNLDDPFLESTKVHGSSFLEKGQEAFQEKHVQEAYARALQSVRPSDKHLVYEGIAGYLVDGEDYRAHPAGIFGKELTIVLHLLFSESAQVQNLRSVVERAGFSSEREFPTALASLYGCLSEDEWRSPNILITASPRVCHVSSGTNGALQNCRSLLINSGYTSDLLEQIGDTAHQLQKNKKMEVFLTGEASEREDFQALVEDRIKKPVHIAGARILDPDFQAPRYSALIGMARLAGAPPLTRSFSRREMKMISGIKMRANSFVQEYF